MASHNDQVQRQFGAVADEYLKSPCTLRALIWIGSLASFAARQARLSLTSAAAPGI